MIWADVDNGGDYYGGVYAYAYYQTLTLTTKRLPTTTNTCATFWFAQRAGAPEIGEQCNKLPPTTHAIRWNSHALLPAMPRVAKWVVRASKKRRNDFFGSNSFNPLYTGGFKREGFSHLSATG